MAHTIIDFVATVDAVKRPMLDRALAGLSASTDLLDGGPLGAIDTLHFASMTVFEDAGFDPLLVFECNCDGTLDEFLSRLLAAASAPLHEILGCCTGYDVASSSDAQGIEMFLRAHRVLPAAAYVGNVGRSCARIQSESDLHKELSARIDDWQRKSPVTTRRTLYERIVREVRRRGHEWVFDGYETGARHAKAHAQRLIGTGAAILLVALFLRVEALGVIAVIAALIVIVLRWHERHDASMDPADTSPSHFAALGRVEDHYRLNHLGSVTIVKDFRFRRVLLRAVLFVSRWAARLSTSGSLSGIPTIHFAHWALLDGGRRLLFLSNYDGSWGSYLDDFVDKASQGLTAIWTNTVGFPPTRLLVQDGARDGAAFKAFARMRQTPAAVWYQAAVYRNEGLTVQRINANSDLRIGIAAGAPAVDLVEWTRLW